MGISMMILLLGICVLLMLFWGGILVSKKKWKLGLAIILLPLSAIVLMISGFLYVSHTTNPDSLELSLQNVQPQNKSYTIKGKWTERIDYYSFGTDFVAICTKDNKQVKMLDYTKGDWKPNYYNFQSAIPDEIKRNSSIPEDCVPQLFDIKTQNEFSFSFHIDNHKETEQVTVYYVHVRIDPMDSPEVWVKTLQIE